MTDEPRAGEVTVVPASQVPWDDLRLIFGSGDPSRCYCQYFKVRDRDWKALPVSELRERFQEQVPLDTGLAGYLDGEPAGWVAVEPRRAYPRLRYARTVWSGRDEDREDPGVWSVTCFIVRKEFRRRGLCYPLAAATIGFARDRGARALEAYPMVTEPGKEIIWNELYRGSRQIFAAAGFTEVSRPSPRRVVMRADFPGR